MSRAAKAVGVGALLAPRLHDVIVQAGPRAPWDQFKKHVVAELHGGRCRIGVGGQCQAVEDFPRSYREAELAMRVQKASGAPEQVTLYDDLGVYKVLAPANETSSIGRFVDEWLARLIDYDSAHGTQLVLTLSEYLECAGNYDASAKALMPAVSRIGDVAAGAGADSAVGPRPGTHSPDRREVAMAAALVKCANCGRRSSGTSRTRDAPAPRGSCDQRALQRPGNRLEGDVHEGNDDGSCRRRDRRNWSSRSRVARSAGPGATAGLELTPDEVTAVTKKAWRGTWGYRRRHEAHRDDRLA